MTYEGIANGGFKTNLDRYTPTPLTQYVAGVDKVISEEPSYALINKKNSVGLGPQRYEAHYNNNI
tara:strand:+ start:1750 stop:1944 length:195 start_codon:yes stop_codon:yes gene_type:complete